MKTKTIVSIFAGLMLLFFALGAADVLRIGNTETGEENQDDRLVGLLVTTEYLDLFDMEGYINDHGGQLAQGGELSEAENAKYQGRIYATLTEKTLTNAASGEADSTWEYVFDKVAGFAYFYAEVTDAQGSYTANHTDAAISDAAIAVSVTDQGESVSLEGTIYVSTANGPRTFYYNPVYQTAQGDVYVTAGNGMSNGGEISAGMSSSHELTADSSATVGDETTTSGVRVKLTVSYLDPPTRIVLLQLDNDSQVVARDEYAPGALPETLRVATGAQYIVAETHTQGLANAAALTRELYQPPTETLETFYSREDGICVKQHTALIWPQ